MSEHNQFSHINDKGTANMVDVTEKNTTQRVAIAEGYVRMSAQALTMLQAHNHAKGDVLSVARIAGIQGAKRCSDLVPLCHPLMLTKVQIDFSIDEQASRVRIEAMCKLAGKTGVEMEALTAVSVAALTLFDMCKAVDPHMCIEDTRVISKTGGKSGDWSRA